MGRGNQTGKELSLGRQKKKKEDGKRNILVVLEAVRLAFALLNPGSSMLDLGDQVLEPSKRLYYEFSGVQLHLCAGQGPLSAGSYLV